MTEHTEPPGAGTRPFGHGRLTGWALVIAPVLIGVGELLHPSRANEPVHQLEIVADHSGAWYWSHLLLFVGVAMTLPAIVGIAARLHARAPRTATLGASLAAAGAVCFAGLLTIGFVVWQMAAGGARFLAPLAESASRVIDARYELEAVR